MEEMKSNFIHDIIDADLAENPEIKVHTRFPPEPNGYLHIGHCKAMIIEQLCADIAEMIQGKTLLLAYNAHFDLSFLFYLLLRDGDPAILKGKDKLDLYTVYRDRRPYPHKLANAIDAYQLSGKVVNSHRAIDDVLATVAVMEAMAQEKDDLLHYINLFGYNPKYGIDGKPIGSVTYKPQAYRNQQFHTPLYQQL